MLIAQARPVVLLVMGVIFLLTGLTVAMVIMATGPLWFQAKMSGVQLSLPEIIGMRLRKTDVKAVVQTLVMAHRAGASISAAEVERAYSLGVDLDKVVLAFIRAKKDDIDVTFQQLVEADLDNRLEDKLQGG